MKYFLTAMFAVFCFVSMIFSSVAVGEPLVVIPHEHTVYVHQWTEEVYCYGWGWTEDEAVLDLDADELAKFAVAEVKYNSPIYKAYYGDHNPTFYLTPSCMSISPEHNTHNEYGNHFTVPFEFWEFYSQITVKYKQSGRSATPEAWVDLNTHTYTTWIEDKDH